MTPLKLNILMHYYACADDYRDLDADPISRIIEDFLTHEILDASSDSNYQYAMTGKGRCYVEGILKAARNVSMPIWTIDYAG